VEVEDLKAKDEQKSQELTRKEEELHELQSKLRLTEVNNKTVQKEVSHEDEDASPNNSEQVKHLQETLVIETVLKYGK